MADDGSPANGVVVPPFVHLDVQSAYGALASPSSPDDYVRALVAQYPLDRLTEDTPRPALALADTSLHSAVKMAAACAREQVDHLVGLRVRVVPTRAYRAWGEQPGELILLAMDETGWLSLVALNNLGHLAGADRAGPRVDWQDLARHCEGLLCLTGAPGTGLLSPAIERAANPAEPGEALALARRLLALFGDRLYLELAFHGRAVDRLVNRGLVSLAERLEIPVVAANAVRYAGREDALPAAVLEAMRRGARAEGLLGAGGGSQQLPLLTLDHPRSQAYLKSAQEMWRLFGRLPAALRATREVADRCRFRLPLASQTPLERRYGPALLFGLEPARQVGEQRLAEAAEDGLRARWHAERSGELPTAAIERLEAELRAICSAGLADLLLVAHEVAAFCREHRIPLSARGSATSSLVAWALGLVDLCPLDHGLDGRSFVDEGRPDLPDLDLEVSSLHEPLVSRFVLRLGQGGEPDPTAERRELPRVQALRLGVQVSLGARQAVRAVGTALGLEAPRVSALARLVPLLSSPGAIEEVVSRSPELGIHDLSTQAEPYNTVLRLAGQLEGLPHRPGPHPSAYAFESYGPGVLAWLPAQWVGSDRWSRQRVGMARHLAVSADGQPARSGLAHLAAPPANEQAAPRAGEADEDGDLALLVAGSGPTLACQWDKEDLEALGVCRLDISPSALLASAEVDVPPDAETTAAAWRLLEAGDTVCVAQVETVGLRMLLKRARELAQLQSSSGQALGCVEDLAQLLALWRPGAYARAREQAYFDVRFARERPAYPHPAVSRVLDRTSGQLVYAEQVVELVMLLGLDWAFADGFRRALLRGHAGERAERERVLRQAARKQGWSPEQTDGLVALLLQHGGYLHSHGHALAMAHRAFRQACLKVNPATTAAFFAEVLNQGGSSTYGLGAAAEEARRFGVLLLPPCVNRSQERFTVEADAPELEVAQARGPAVVGAVRVPLTAIRGLSPGAPQHILAVRATFGAYASLLDFSRKLDRDRVSRADVVLLIKLGAFAFTGVPRAQLAVAEQVYSSAAELLRAADRDPSGPGLSSVEGDLPGAAALEVAEWPPEVLAAYELAHLGFYVSAPFEIQRHRQRLAEEFGVAPIAELAELPDRAPASVAGIVTALRVRTTKKGERMAWLTLADGTGAVEAAAFPRAYAKTGVAAALREGAFLVAQGRLAHEEATGTKLFIDEVTPMAGRGARVSALAVAVEERRGEPAPWAGQA